MNFSAIGASWQLPHFIGPYAAGGTVDIIARAIQEPLRKTLGQPIIVEVKPGASGLIATRYVARAPADGYTLLVQTNAQVITYHINKSAGVAPLQDFEPVGRSAIRPPMPTPFRT